MNRATRIVAPLVALAISTQAIAAPKIVIQPIQQADEHIRYDHGSATVDIFSESGSVQVRPAPMDHGSLAFNVAVYNDASQSANVDVSSFSLTSESVTVAALSVDELERKAKNRATWATVGLALAGGLTAAAAASQRDHYRSTLYTPHGAYRYTYSAPSTAGQIQAAAIAGGTAYGIVSIQRQLDQTLDDLGDQIIQMSTVNPHESYAGKIVFNKVKLPKLPAQVTMIVDWNGQKYPFTFQIAKAGTPAPPFRPSTIEPEPKPPIIIQVPQPVEAKPSPLAATEKPAD
ncbi:hypothetical protein CA833_14615 [Novosphingobium sp. KA1]|nr:hypothetical protein CA833_14615 [Novosphingobium sp. KA1]